jgi:hypothetical protein
LTKRIRLCVDRVEVRDEPELRDQRHQDTFGSDEQRTAGVDGIPRVGGECDIPWVKECEVEIEDALLRANRGHHFTVRIKFDRKAPGVELRNRAAELFAPAV